MEPTLTGGVVGLSPKMLEDTFDCQAWREYVDALFDASGLSVVVMDEPANVTVHAANRCTYCDATYEGRSSAAGSCFDDAPTVGSAGITHVLCRGGLPSYLAPIVVGGVHRGNVVVGGFVTSTRERKRLFERLLGRGMPEAQARKAVREVPVITKHEVDSLLRMSVAIATQMLEGEHERRDGGRRARELECFVAAALELSELRSYGAELFAVVLTEAMRVVSADRGTLLLPRAGTSVFEVAATNGVPGGQAPGRVVRIDEGPPAKVLETARGLLVSRDRQKQDSEVDSQPAVCSLWVPLLSAGEIIGMLDLEVTGGDRHFETDDLRQAEEYARIAAAVIVNARERSLAERTLEESRRQAEFGKALGVAADVDEIAEIGAKALRETLVFSVGGVIVTGWGRDQAFAVANDQVSRADVELALGEASGRDVSQAPFHELRLIDVPDLADDAGASDVADWVTMSTELIVRGTVFGYMFVAARGQGAFGGDDRRLLEGFADHAAAAMERVATLERLRDDLAKTITALSATLDAGEHAERGHSDRVMDYAMSIGEELGLSVEEIEVLRFAGLLHDVGKLGLSEEILLKPSRLSETETQLVRMHAEIGANVVEQIDFLNSITPVILHHHERWDGNGYPMGIAGEEIPLLARIVAVADAFDAMTATRPYRPRLSYSQAKTELMKGAGLQFDPRVVEAFLEAMDRRALAGASGLFAQRGASGPQLPA